MYEIMSADEAIRLIRDGDCICVNSFVGIESPVELHEALYRRYQRMQSPRHLTVVSSAGFGVWDEERNAEGYIREGAVDRLICGHFGAMLSTKKLVLEDRFEAYIFRLDVFHTRSAPRQEAAGSAFESRT
ncbi:CoA-transferase [Coprococcus sp. AF21-14LB]|uniref:CoA-transferase n=1 Tax=Coprococcus sp. AF21-14LB TaxID=2292231 RepID=UPI00241FAC0F|nr:CoA-transferase [Coprococcus sp. AF21-14LB]